MNAEGERRGPETDVAPAFARDTWADKGVRFVCGAVLATAVVGGLAIFIPVGTVSAVVVVWLVASVLCGVVAAVAGERSVKSMLRLIGWL